MHQNSLKSVKEKLEKQVFLRLCTDRNSAVRKMRIGIPQSHMGEKRQKEDCLEMLKPVDQWSEEMW